MLKADVAGSLEALEDEIAKLPQDEVAVNVIHRGVGGINESDVMLAAASDGVVLGFNVRPGRRRARGRRPRGRRDPHLRGHLPRIEELRAAMEGMLEPEEVEETARRRSRCARSSAPRAIGTIAGSLRHRRQGHAAAPRCASCATAPSSTTARSPRLRRFNDDVREVAAGFECGIVLENFQDVRKATCSRSTRRARSSASSRRRSAAAGRLRRRPADRPALPGRREPEGQAQGARVGQGAAAERLGRRPWPRSAIRTAGSAATLAAALTGGRRCRRSTRPPTRVERWSWSRFPQGVARRAHGACVLRRARMELG